MSADPYIQAPDDLQSHNRYAYVMNNPLNLTDPSGFSWISKAWKKAWKSPIFKAVLGIVVAIYAPALLNYFFGAATTTLGMAANAVGSGMLSGFASTGTLKGAMLGGLTAGIMFGAGEIAKGLTLADGSIGKMALHAGAGCLSSVAGGGDCKSGAISGALGELGHNIKTGNSIELGTIKAAMLGGIGSKISGGKFADGAVTGAFGYMFNCVAHKCNTGMYDLDDPKSHISEPQSSPSLCNVSTDGCLQAARTELGCNSAPGQSGCTNIGEEKSYTLTGGNPITQYRVSADMIINGTSQGHTFHDGAVVRWLSVNAAGNVSIWTAGYGTNTSELKAFVNSRVGAGLFNNLGIDNARGVRSCLKGFVCGK